MLCLRNRSDAEDDVFTAFSGRGGVREGGENRCGWQKG